MPWIAIEEEKQKQGDGWHPSTLLNSAIVLCDKVTKCIASEGWCPKHAWLHDIPDNVEYLFELLRKNKCLGAFVGDLCSG